MDFRLEKNFPDLGNEARQWIVEKRQKKKSKGALLHA